MVAGSYLLAKISGGTGSEFSLRSRYVRRVSLPISGGRVVSLLYQRSSSFRRVSLPISGGRAISWLYERLSSVRLVSSPISIGRVVSRLPERSSSSRLVSSVISGGSAVSLLRERLSVFAPSLAVFLIFCTCLAAQPRPHHLETVESLLRPRCQHCHNPLVN